MSRYAQTPPPQTVGADRDLLDVVRWTAEEFQKLGAASDLAQDLEVVGEEPEVLVEGMVRYFSAGGFDPGQGPGAYIYTLNSDLGQLEWRPLVTAEDKGAYVGKDEPSPKFDGLCLTFADGAWDPGYGPGPYCYCWNPQISRLQWRPLFEIPPVSVEPDLKWEGMTRYFSHGGFDPGGGAGLYTYSYLPEISEWLGRRVYWWRPLFNSPSDRVEVELADTEKPVPVTTEWTDILQATIPIHFNRRLRVNSMLNGASTAGRDVINVEYHLLVNGVELSDFYPGWALDMGSPSITPSGQFTTTASATSDPALFDPADGFVQEYTITIQARSDADGAAQVNDAFLELEEVN